MRHRRSALGDQQRHEPAERMRDRGVNGAVVIAHGEHGPGALRQIGAAPGAVSVRGKVERHDAQARAAQRLDERRHEGGLAGPAMHEHDRLARDAVGLEDVGLHLAGGRRHALPRGMAQMKACALGELVVVARAVMRQLGRAEDAERRIAGRGVGKTAKPGSAAHIGAADRAKSLVSRDAVHVTPRRMQALEGWPLGLVSLRRIPVRRRIRQKPKFEVKTLDLEWRSKSRRGASRHGDYFHFIEHPTQGICVAGPLPVLATSVMASSSSRLAPLGGGSVRPSSSRPR